MRQIFGFLTGILIGWLVGSTIALLVAPKPGDALRGDIRARSTGFIDEIKDASKQRRAQLEEKLAALRAPHSAS